MPKPFDRQFKAGFAVYAATTIFLGGSLPAAAQTPLPTPAAPAAWRVECAGDGKKLDCQAIQQIVQRENRQLVVQLSARVPADTKTPVMMIQLPLGLNLAEPLLLQVDKGQAEKQQIQTCTASGCFAGMTMNDKFLAAMRAGTDLNITMQDSNKRAITIDVPLLGFGLALDKAWP